MFFITLELLLYFVLFCFCKPRLTVNVSVRPFPPLPLSPSAPLPRRRTIAAPRWSTPCRSAPQQREESPLTCVLCRCSGAATRHITAYSILCCSTSSMPYHPRPCCLTYNHSTQYHTIPQESIPCTTGYNVPGFGVTTPFPSDPPKRLPLSLTLFSIGCWFIPG